MLPGFDEAFGLARRFSVLAGEEFGGSIVFVVLAGSSVRGDFSGGSDVDVAVVVRDDSDAGVVGEGLERIAGRVSGSLQVMPVLSLSGFIGRLLEGDPVVLRVTGEGVPVYDPLGVFASLGRLLGSGLVPVPGVTVDRLMADADRRVRRALGVKLLVLAEDVYYAFTEAAQATLVSLGYRPPPPGLLVECFRSLLVDRGLLDAEYAGWLGEIIGLRKRIEREGSVELDSSVIDVWVRRYWVFAGELRRIQVEHGSREGRLVECTVNR